MTQEAKQRARDDMPVNAELVEYKKWFYRHRNMLREYLSKPATPKCYKECSDECGGGSCDFVVSAALSQPATPEGWKPASEAPYDEMCLFYTIDGNIVQGFIYDGDEKDFGYTHFMPLPAAPVQEEKE